MASNRQRTNDEQMAIRQSAPKPTAMDELNRMSMEQMPISGTEQPLNQPMQTNMVNGQGRTADGSLDGFRALAQPIGKEFVHKATLTLQKYKEGKANLERRIVEDEQWYKLRHWECMRHERNQVEPTSGWLFNCIANKHADAMDAFPSPNVLPREESDKAQAKMLTSIIPVILDQNDFEKTYSEVWNYKLKTGTGVYGIFWNPEKDNIGNIDIKKLDILNLFWEPGITDIQESRNVFHVQLVDNEQLISQYPQLNGKLGSATISIAKYIYDDNVDTSNKSVKVDLYYKKANSQGKTVLHYCSFVNDEVLFATENDEMFAERGFYDHAKYPLILDKLFSVEGSPAGFGYVDIGKSAQEYIDRGNQAIMQNMLSNARPRYFVRSDGSVNEHEYADMNNDFVHVDGNLGNDSIMPINGKPLSSIYVEVIANKIEELKETTGNRDISTGGSASGVTAASAIAALQESGSKLSRDANKQSYRAYREMILMVIELIRQFYDMPRCFRILGERGTQEFVMYSNAGIQPQPQGMEFGIDMGLRIPLFDIEVTAQKQSPYSKMSQNELALQFYQAGFFNPQMADQALACLDMMDFDRKDFIMQKIQQNGGMLQQMMMLAQMADSKYGTNDIQASLAAQYGMPMGNMGEPNAAARQAMGSGEDSTKGDESSVTKNARTRVAESTAPR